MEEPVVEVIEAATDLTPVLDALQLVNEHLVQLQDTTYQHLIFLSMLCGMVLGTVLIMIVYDLWRHH